MAPGKLWGLRRKPEGTSEDVSISDYYDAGFQLLSPCSPTLGIASASEELCSWEQQPLGRSFGGHGVRRVPLSQPH